METGDAVMPDVYVGGNVGNCGFVPHSAYAASLRLRLQRAPRPRARLAALAQRETLRWLIDAEKLDADETNLPLLVERVRAVAASAGVRASTGQVAAVVESIVRG
jgi:hypothetical protein